ncbi:MAG TPA: lanthionine synthetase LanC family protein [Puia sp.]|jgi:serine/threonine protein kinase
MATTGSYIETMRPGKADSSEKVMQEYSWLLEKYGVPFTRNRQYLQVGSLTPKKGWILDLTVNDNQITQLLEALIPVLLHEEIPFQIPANQEIALALLSGFLGYTQIGKVICVFPGSGDRAIQVARLLVLKTSGFSGPIVPTDYHLEGIVYTRYGSHSPIVTTNSYGVEVVSAYDEYGNEVKDDYPIPFDLPVKVSWPYQRAWRYSKPKSSESLQGKYYIKEVLKYDVKGRVMRAVSLKAPYGLLCFIIKEGLKDMGMDPLGRDVRDKLNWQYQVHKDLEGYVPIAKAYDIFADGDKTYFVMEAIAGTPIGDISDSLHNSTHWAALPAEVQKKVLTLFLAVLDIVQRFNRKGYYHRDLNSRNFLVTDLNNSTIYPIDLELAYDHINKLPNPHFLLGSAGYMSPEQLAKKEPTIEQEVFGLGGLMIRVFTGLSPKIINTCQHNTLRRQLDLLLQDNDLAELIHTCVHPIAANRPSLAEISSRLNVWRDRSVDSTLSREELPEINKDEVRDVIQKGINGLAGSALLSEEGLWFSKIARNANYVNNALHETTYSLGFEKGIAGVLYFIPEARLSGFSIARLKNSFQKNWDLLSAQQFTVTGANNPGLFYGASGALIAYDHGIKAELLAPLAEIGEIATQCYQAKLKYLTIRQGYAGLGLAALQSTNLLSKENALNFAAGIANEIVTRQEKDGSWLIFGEGWDKERKALSLADGIAGIVYFLVSYRQISKDPTFDKAIERGLRYLIGCSDHSKNIAWRNDGFGNPLGPWLNSGVSGLSLLFTKAYKVTGEEKYKKIAEGALRGINKRLVTPYLSLSNGAAGIGLAYVKTWEAFHAEEWKKRSDCITSLLLSTSQVNNITAQSWITDNTITATADYMTGSTGVLTYLIKYYKTFK